MKWNQPREESLNDLRATMMVTRVKCLKRPISAHGDSKATKESHRWGLGWVDRSGVRERGRKIVKTDNKTFYNFDCCKSLRNTHFSLHSLPLVPTSSSYLWAWNCNKHLHPFPGPRLQAAAKHGVKQWVILYGDNVLLGSKRTTTLAVVLHFPSVIYGRGCYMVMRCHSRCMPIWSRTLFTYNV